MYSFGFHVHGKQTVLEKVGISHEHSLFRWAVGTRGVDNSKERWQCVTEMNDMGGKWATFSLWLQQNLVAIVLWFQSFHKQNLWGSCMVYVMLTTNRNEATNNRLKTTTSYLLSSLNGLLLCEVIRLLKKEDEDDWIIHQGKVVSRFAPLHFLKGLISEKGPQFTI